MGLANYEEIASAFLTIVKDLLDRVYREELGKIVEAAKLVADAASAGRVLHVIGAGHSAIVGEEMFYRAGGLAIVNPIIDTDITVGHGAERSTLLEKVQGYAEALLRSARVSQGDVVLVVSTSGVNTFPVEAAIKAKEMGAKTIGITSVSYSRSLEPRNPYGRRLFEVVDVAIDNKVPPGDAVLEIEGVRVKVAPVSTIVNSFIVHTMTAIATRMLVERGIEPPIWLSSHLPGADQHNRKLFEAYRGRIPLL